MSELTINNINFITEEVSKAGITFSHLRDELIDHICCNVESDMQQGLSFEEAFDKTKKVIGNKGLKKVQEDTLLLIDKKYRFMKKTMKIVGWISMLMITVGALFKIQHWPGAGPLLVFGFFFLGAIFFPSALWVMKKESKLKGSLFIYLFSMLGSIILIFGILFKIQHYPGAGLFLTIGFSSIGLILIPALLISKLRDENTRNLHSTFIIGAISLIIYLVGDLFKIMHWQGAAPCLIVGAIGLTTIFFPIYAMKVYKNAETIKAGFLFLCTGILFFNMFNILLAINVSRDVLGFLIKPGSEISMTANILENKSNALSEKLLTVSIVSDTTFKSHVTKVKAISDELSNFIENIKADLISEVDGISEDETKAEIKNPTCITNKDGADVSMNILLGNTEDGKNGKASQIKMKIETLKNSLLNYCNSDESAKIIITKALETKDSVNIKGQGTYSWEIYNFYRLPVISTVNRLCFYQRNIRIAELETLESLNSCYIATNRNLINKTK